ncbi:methyltransferase domain-containing protein [Candidatus Mycobacterium wuenschmannii]|uniref:Methyltransferase domain-containing protein n=1 Tax=Candidatus Mycobacterium wuenschmannii TaxID=3027808 RepID=A0ABY8W0F7_9MYCO|nr:methyltransferase domain-containing protein [Candidatus Mycobacterium wuenschmannii]WIM87249.1 methyltransferase domain-containing protein [Candidatus Mycobacterium wuenschmannii]
MSDAAAAEFDTLAEWTAEVAGDLGREFHIPAGCRGSGSPAVLDWLLDHLELGAGESLLDCGAGVGGPAAYAAAQRDVRPVLVEPQAGGCRAARELFGFEAIQADAAKLPFEAETFDAAWALGVLCTTEEQVEMLCELRRVVRASGPIALLVLVARELSPPGEPEDSFFPTRDLFAESVQRAGLRIETCRSVGDIWEPPESWRQRVDAVEAELERRYGDQEAWQVAEQQSRRITRLLKDSEIDPQVFLLRRAA